MTTRQATNTTVGKLSWKGVVSTVVGAGIAWVAAHLTGYELSKWAEISVVAVPAYFAGIGWLEAKYPKLSWLFLLFPHKTATPAKPAVKKSVVKSRKAVK